jgi:hypothetical protein
MPALCHGALWQTGRAAKAGPRGLGGFQLRRYAASADVLVQGACPQEAFVMIAVSGEQSLPAPPGSPPPSRQRLKVVC